MVSQTRKRIVILLGIVVILFLLVRYVIFNGSLDAVSIPQVHMRTIGTIDPQQHAKSHVGYFSFQP